MRHEILAHSVAFLAVCIGASCTTPQGTGSATSSAQEPPPPVLVKWDDLPIELKKASVPPYSAISYCAVRASSQCSDAEAVKPDLAACLSAHLLTTHATFLLCHLRASRLQRNANAEPRQNSVIH